MISVNRHRNNLTTAVIGAALVFSGAALAQGVPCPTPPKPYGGRMLDVSRNVSGTVQQGITYFYVCQNAAGNGEVTRHTYRQPIHLDLGDTTLCDELPVKLVLDGYYYSQTRMNSPITPDARNVRIGWHSGTGKVFDTAGNLLGTAKFEGTIGVNTSRPPLQEGVGDCFVCGHHTGEIVITFLSTSTIAANKGTIKAFYQFDAHYLSSKPCEQSDPCETAFTVDQGTLDGINFRKCQ